MVATACTWADFVVLTQTSNGNSLFVECVPFRSLVWDHMVHKVKSFYKHFFDTELLTRREQHEVQLLPFCKQLEQQWQGSVCLEVLLLFVWILQFVRWKVDWLFTSLCTSCYHYVVCPFLVLWVRNVPNFLFMYFLLSLCSVFVFGALSSKYLGIFLGLETKFIFLLNHTSDKDTLS